eukprot:CAMPEP_0182501844 /NCGR_PEP_ID=MMETSP1321-20130603/12176_1 /TAXON_ID=91990 /ORGANISM="Bolidomonas sp., Strain RCC1657" /LENGTH=45 /DNA_ID= /DNA_START= /DNA_END= /DNA_ORIENTATION=
MIHLLPAVDSPPSPAPMPLCTTSSEIGGSRPPNSDGKPLHHPPLL